jgi:hypothetical protein
MIRVETARGLRDGGLAWKPVHGDRFVAPDRGMDELVFVINDMATIIEMLQGAPAVTFHGTPEPIARAVAARPGADRLGHVRFALRRRCLHLPLRVGRCGPRLPGGRC